MAESRTGIAMEFESQLEARLESRSTLLLRDRRRSYGDYPKPGLSRQAFVSLLMCFPVTCMLWAAIIYGALRLAR